LATSRIGGLIAGAALEANDGPLHLATKGAHAAIPVGVIARLGLISGPLPPSALQRTPLRYYETRFYRERIVNLRNTKLLHQV
jgi:hypothetical protein